MCLYMRKWCKTACNSSGHTYYIFKGKAQQQGCKYLKVIPCGPILFTPGWPEPVWDSPVPSPALLANRRGEDLTQGS